MSRGIVTRALFNHAAKHERLERYLATGARRALTRAGRAGIDAKARAALSAFNLKQTPYRGVNAIKRAAKVRTRDLTAVERISGPTGIALKFFGARNTRAGVTFQIRRGQPVTLRGGFLPEALGKNAFTRIGRDRLPIRKRFGPGIAQIMDSSDIRAAGDTRFVERINEELRKEETRALKRSGL